MRAAVLSPSNTSEIGLSLQLPISLLLSIRYHRSVEYRSADFSFTMQRETIGDWGAWNPEMAPQEITMKSIGKRILSVGLEGIFLIVSMVSSGDELPCKTFVGITPLTITAIIIRKAPK